MAATKQLLCNNFMARGLGESLFSEPQAPWPTIFVPHGTSHAWRNGFLTMINGLLQKSKTASQFHEFAKSLQVKITSLKKNQFLEDALRFTSRVMPFFKY